MKTEPITQEIHGFIPVAEVSNCPDWVSDVAAELHGDGKLVCGTNDDGAFMVLYRSTWLGSRPPGDWIIVYAYDHDSGTNSHRLFAAARIAR